MARDVSLRFLIPCLLSHCGKKERLDVLQIPRDLSGRSVLDVGAWDGFFSFEAERRGAARVVAADCFAWQGENWSDKSGFELARRALNSGVEDVDIDVMDLGPHQVGTFDLVLFLGVLYHMRHPLLALERLASVTRDQLMEAIMHAQLTAGMRGLELCYRAIGIILGEHFARINQIIHAQQPQITSILAEYGVPMLDDRNQPLTPPAQPAAGQPSHG